MHPRLPSRRAHVSAYNFTVSDTPHPADELIDPVTDKDHALGPADAPVTLVEYGDYECPDCLNAEPIVAALRERLGDQLRVIYRHFPRTSIHPRSAAAAAAAEAAAAQGKFWVYHKGLFDHQKELHDLDLIHLAVLLGLEVYRFQASLEAPATARRVSDDYGSAIRHGLKATPTFFINGRRYTGEVTVAAMEKALRDAMAEAQTR